MPYYREGNESFLLQNGANIEAKNHNGDTPLFLAIYQGFPESVNILLEYGANKNSTNNKDETPYQYAVRLNRTEIVELIFNFEKNIRALPHKVHDLENECNALKKSNDQLQQKQSKLLLTITDMQKQIELLIRQVKIFQKADPTVSNVSLENNNRKKYGAMY